MVGVQFGLAPRTSTEQSEGSIPVTSELAQLQPILESMTCRVDTNGAEPEAGSFSEISISRKPASGRGADAHVRDLERQVLPFDVKRIDPQTEVDVTKQRPAAKIFGASVRHFLPSQVGFRYDKRKYISQRVAELVCGPAGVGSYFEPEIEQFIVPTRSKNFILDSIVDYSQRTEFRDLVNVPPVGEFVVPLRDRPLTAHELALRLDTLSRNFPRARQQLRALLVESREEFQRTLTEEAEISSEQGFDVSFPRHLTTATEQLTGFFQSSIYYLGPLRDEPRPIYPLEALINPRDVGYRGEHTAAVLDLHRDSLVRCFKSADATNLVGAKQVSVTLRSAVIDWLSYLGVAEAVDTTDLGKIGHQLQVSVDRGAEAHDLTNVGVGVSQLLPIVVMSLLADTPSCLIFEQPELHLHPKVQARLADFFFSLSLLGKQCILETHSEYLVERFRRRIAEAPGESLGEQVKIYFTQKIEGRSRCSEVKITKFGSVLEWPEDFFDQSQVETESILRAAQAKRNIERSQSPRAKK